MTATAKKVGGISGVAAAIIAAVFALEGGYVNDPKDPGGETNHGITKTVAQQNGYTGSMKDLTQEMAASIYYKDYIEKPGFVPMLEISPVVSQKLVDAGVNTGTTRPSRWFQTGLNALSRGCKDFPQINVDGKVGFLLLLPVHLVYYLYHLLHLVRTSYLRLILRLLIVVLWLLDCISL